MRCMSYYVLMNKDHSSIISTVAPPIRIDTAFGSLNHFHTWRVWMHEYYAQLCRRHEREHVTLPTAVPITNID